MQRVQFFNLEPEHVSQSDIFETKEKYSTLRKIYRKNFKKYPPIRYIAQNFILTFRYTYKIKFFYLKILRRKYFFSYKRFIKIKNSKNIKIYERTSVNVKPALLFPLVTA